MILRSVCLSVYLYVSLPNNGVNRGVSQCQISVPSFCWGVGQFLESGVERGRGPAQVDKVRQLSRRTQFLKFFSRYCVFSLPPLFCYCKVIRFNGTFTNLQRFEGPIWPLSLSSSPSLPLCLFLNSFSLSLAVFMSFDCICKWFAGGFVLCGQLHQPHSCAVGCLFIYLFHFVSFKANFVRASLWFWCLAFISLFFLSSSVFFVASAAKFHFFHISNHKNYARTYTQIHTHTPQIHIHAHMQSIPSRTLIKCAFSRALWVAKYINIYT